MRKLALLLFAASFAMPMAGAHAAAAKKEQNKSTAQKELKETKSAIEEAKKRAEEYEKKAEALKKELTPLQEKMAELAGEMRVVEQALLAKESELVQLEAELDTRTAHLNERKQQIGQSIDAMVQLQRVPPEAVVARPGSVKDTIRAAQLLSSLNQQLQKDAQDLQLVLAELETTQVQIRTKQEEIRAELTVLDKKKQTLDSQMRERTELQKKLLSDRDSERKKLDKLSKNSKSLQELIQKIEQRERELARENQRTARVSPHNASEIAKLDRSDGSKMQKAAKQMRLPVSGKVIKRFGEKDKDGTTLRGVRIAARAGAMVVAPYKGQVVFTGPFLDYGKMVILRHPGGYHSLLAGISEIRCTPGQMMVEGEPIGTMGERAPATELYLELRDHSTPVNPAGWFTGL
jgi:septal ring factor EnvC (AmiA/AmiB activator)